MAEQPDEPRVGGDQTDRQMPSFSRPVWPDQQMTCEQCRYNDQDIDTFPCAKCHTRH